MSAAGKITPGSGAPAPGTRRPAAEGARAGAPFAWRERFPFFQAGLAGYSDTAMRLIARRHGCGYCVSEALLDQRLIAGGKGRRCAEIVDEDHPIAGQIIGSQPGEMAQAARILLDMGYDVIEVNLACPVKKIRKRARGGHLLSEPARAIDMLKAVRDAVGDEAPVTVKLRRGYDHTPEARDAVFAIIEAAIAEGCFSTTVHGRTVKQKYIGPSHWPSLKELTTRYAAEMAGGFQLFGSGDVFTAEAAVDMMRRTGVQAVAVARGCIGNPWIFRQIRQIIDGQAPAAPTLGEQRAVLLEHFELSARWHGEKPASRMMRKFGIKFARHHPGAHEVARAFIAVKSAGDWRAVVNQWYRSD